MTQPAGSVTYNNYELLLHGVTYGVTDRVQASADRAVADRARHAVRRLRRRQGPHPVDRRAFTWRCRGRRAGPRVRPMPSARNIYTVGAGAFASYCLREDCSSLASASATYQAGLRRGGQPGRPDVVIYGGSIVHRVGRHVKLLGEVASAAAGLAAELQKTSTALLVGYGVRFHTDRIAARRRLHQAGLRRATDGFLIGLPFVSVSYRWE